MGIGEVAKHIQDHAKVKETESWFTAYQSYYYQFSSNQQSHHSAYLQ